MKISFGINKRIIIAVRTLVLLVAAITITGFLTLLIMSPGKIEQLRDKEGKRIGNSIAEKRLIEINGVKMGMVIKSKDASNPVLLFVHGGPGMPEYFLTGDYPTGLEDYFTVVWWDQRGAGLSFSSDINPSTVTVNQYIEDTIGVTNYLRESFGQEKIYLMAHSWGTYFGIQAVKKEPQLFSGYIAVAQITDQAMSEQKAYEYMLDYYKKAGDDKTLESLSMNHYLSDGYNKIRDDVMHRAGIGTTRDMKSIEKGIFLASLKNQEYTLTEKINLWRGRRFLSKYTKLTTDEDIQKKVSKLDVPVYFFSGLYDYTVNFQMAEDYFKQIDAPIKGFYLFRNSAHSPIFEEPGKVGQIIKNDILNRTTDLADTK